MLTIHKMEETKTSGDFRTSQKEKLIESKQAKETPQKEEKPEPESNPGGIVLTEEETKGLTPK